MSTLESQLRSALAEEAGDVPSFPDLAERVRADASRTGRRRRVRTSALVAGVAATIVAVAVLTLLRPEAPLPVGPATAATGTAAYEDAAAAAQAVDAQCREVGASRPVDPPHLPVDLGPVTAAYTCGTGTHVVPGDGTWMFREVRKVTRGLEATLRAYAVPDQTDNPGGCLNRGYLHKMLVVEVGGRFRAVREPVIDCGAPLQSAIDAYEAMTTEVVTSVRLSQVDSPLTVASGCSLQVKDTITLLPMMQGLPASPPPATLPVAEAVTACVYGANPDPDGTLTAETRLTSAEDAQVRALVGSATVDPTCGTTPHTRFAVLEGSGLPWTEIALDGCSVDQGSGALRALAELQTLLLAALTHRIVVG